MAKKNCHSRWCCESNVKLETVVHANGVALLHLDVERIFRKSRWNWKCRQTHVRLFLRWQPCRKASQDPHNRLSDSTSWKPQLQMLQALPNKMQEAGLRRARQTRISPTYRPATNGGCRRQSAWN